MQVTESIRTTLKNTLEELIKTDTEKTVFLCGGYGAFDALCSSTLRELRKHFEIQMIYVTPYMNEAQQEKMNRLIEWKEYDSIVYPPIESVPPKLAILRRNQWMVESAEIIVAFVNCSYGGAYQALKYANRKKKKIINLAEKG